MTKQAEWLTAYVEKCMAEAWGDEPDGLTRLGHLLAYRAGTAACVVRVESQDPLMVRVMAKAVVAVRPTARLLREMNEVNARSRVAHVWWDEHDVVVEYALFAESVDTDSLRQARFQVSAVANDIGVGFAAMFDGETPYPPFDNDSQDAA